MHSSDFLADYFFKYVFGSINWVGKFIQRHKVFECVLELVIAFFITRKYDKATIDTLHAFLVFALIGLIAFFIVQMLFPLFLQAISFAPCSGALISLGFVEASNKENSSYVLQAKYLKQHQSNNKIKVICISGSRFFVKAQNKAGTLNLPLHQMALAGKLDVIMSHPSSKNLTVQERWKSYGDKATELDYDTPEKLAQEVQSGIDWSLEHNNIVTSHNILCMWRVMITDGHCLIQSYFPNKTKTRESHSAPVLVFKKTNNEFDYYRVFDEMFDLVKKTGELQKKPT